MRVRLEDIFVPVAIAVLILALSMASDVFATTGNFRNILIQMTLLAIVAFGVTIVMLGGAFDLSVGSQVALHGMIAALVMRETGSITLGVIAGLASGGIFGIFNGVLVGYLRINPFIATLGTLVLARGLALNVSDARVISGLPTSLREFGASTFLNIPLMVWLMFLAFAIAAWVAHGTRFGVRVFAVGGNKEAARLAGINVGRVQLATFGLSGLFAAGAALVLVARVRSGQPLAGELMELYAIAAVVLGGTSLWGGRGAVWRTMLGVLLIVVIQNGLTLLNVGTAYKMVTVGIVFLLAAVAETFRGKGIEIRLGKQRNTLLR